MKRRIAVVVGTRPEIIKMAEIVRLLGDNALLIHTGQHWDHTMSGTFMAQLELPAPDVTLAIGGGTRAEQIAHTMLGLEASFTQERPAAVMVQGDTNTVVGAALVANAMGIPLAHVEAGLRSFDRAMPEEHNRIVTDHIADVCLAPTENSRRLLLAEGIPEERIIVTGNTVVAAVSRALGQVGESPSILATLGLEGREFIVSTVHRPENTDTAEALTLLFRGLASIVAQACPVVVPLHPRTRTRLEMFGLLDLLEPLTVIDPIGYEDFVALASRAVLVVSDSGGVQEEASVWKRPVIVVRRSTERPEGTGTFSFLTDPGDSMVTMTLAVFRDRAALTSDLRERPSPYGGLDAAQACVDAVLTLLHQRDRTLSPTSEHDHALADGPN